MQILERIMELRNERNWTEYRLSEAADIPQSTISSWYKKDMLPSITSLEKICDAFGVTLSQFFMKDGSPVELTERQLEMLNKWTLLNRQQQDAVINLLNSFIE